MTSPADRLAKGDGTVADLADLDQARAAAREDVDRLLLGYAQTSRDLGEERAHCAYVTGLQRDWDPLLVACALVEALSRLAHRDLNMPA